jgi:hypothetical protein
MTSVDGRVVELVNYSRPSRRFHFALFVLVRQAIIIRYKDVAGGKRCWVDVSS